jgi:hypothetical protein
LLIEPVQVAAEGVCGGGEFGARGVQITFDGGEFMVEGCDLIVDIVRTPSPFGIGLG